MGDKFKSEVQKPVNNPLLSGAGHGFPFDTFQGSSLLVPVTQDNPSVLTGQPGEPDKFIGQDVPSPDGSRLNDALNIAVDTRSDHASATQSSTGNQRYDWLFNKFFGGSGKSEQETRQERGNDQQSSGSVSSTPRSFSPYVHVPNFQTVTPALQVPSVSNASESVHAIPPYTETGIDALSKNPEVSDFTPSEDRPPLPPQAGFVASSNFQNPGYQYQNPGGSYPPSTQYTSSQQSGWNPGGQTHDKPIPFPVLPVELDSSDASKPPLNNPNAPPLANPNAPPLFRDSSKTYRLSHNKRPVYAPIPGLTLSASGTSSFMQTGDATPALYTSPTTTAAQPVAHVTPTVAPSSQTPAFSAPPTAVSQPTAYVAPTISSQFSSTPTAVQTGYPVPAATSESLGYTQSTAFPPPPTAVTQPAAFPPPPPSALTQPSAFSPPPSAVTQPSAFPPPPSAVTQSSAFPPPPSAGAQPTSFPPPPSAGTQPTSFPPPPSTVTQPTALTPPSTVSQRTVYTSAEPAKISTQTVFKESTVPSQSNIPTASSYFSHPSAGDSFQPSMTSSAPKQTEPHFQAPQQSTPTQTPLPYPPTSASNEKPSLFAPISKANPQPPESKAVFNPVAVHPSGNLPTNLQPQTPKDENPSPTIVPPSLSNLAHVGRTGITYRPPYHHWFYKKETDSKEFWYPFSMTDSVALEQAYQSPTLDENTVIATDGGRYDVNVIRRARNAVYWEETPKEVRRCSWFFRNQNDSRYKPYDENTAYHLEEEYRKCVTTDSWRKSVSLNSGEYVVLYSTTNMAHFESNIPMPDGWEGDFADGSQPLPSPVRMVKRGISDDFDIDDGESPRVDHLVFVVHGIGSVCDLKFRTIEEAVDVFRSFSHKLSRTHFSNSMKQGLVNRIEILPVSWHSHLHGETTGLDKRLDSITLKSIPRLRNFTNDTLLDILFYTSPVYCQNIVQQVGREITAIYAKFKSRNPTFNGGVSLVGHSLGSLILFDMLCHQKPEKMSPEPSFESLKAEARLTRRMSGFVIGNVETQQPFIEYPQLPFKPIALFALGSPIGMFITVRGIDSLGKTFILPTCPRFFNIFHPFDPVAYRIEALINPEMANKRPVLIPHHKGRKRMHLELKETLTRVGADLKQRLVDSIRSTWNTVYQLTAFGRADDGLEQEVDQVIEKQLAGSESSGCLMEQEATPCDVGRLNQGRRVDFVLQEAPLESFNEYVSAIRSHLIYWDSEDTILMILREIYNAEGIAPDAESLVGQDSTGSNSPSAMASAPGVGWNLTDDAQAKPGAEGQAPSYGFINE